MRKYSHIFKRTQSWILVLAIMMSVMNPLWAMSVIAKDDGKTEVTLTEGEVIANNYALTEAEDKFLRTELLKVDTFTYVKPTNEDNLISVDTENKIVFVNDYTGDGNAWEIRAVRLIVGGETVETVEIENGKGSYTYDGNAFSVEATYALDVEIEKSRQEFLINALGSIYNSLPSPAKVAEAAGNIKIVERENVRPIMVDLIDGMEISTQFGTGTVSWGSNEAGVKASKAVEALDEQMNNNGGLLDLTVMINDYKAAESKVEYLINNGVAMKAKAKETSTHLTDILGSDLWGLLAWAIESDDTIALELLQEYLTSANDILKEAIGMDWTAAEADLFENDVTTAEFKTVDDIVALSQGNFADVAVNETLRVAEASVRFNLSMFDVKAEVVINYVNESNKVVEYSVRPNVVITLGAGTIAEDVIDAIEKSGIENKALAEVFAAIYAEGKFDVEKTELPEKLNSDITYTITYTPKNFDVITDYAGTKSYPYGTVITLPKHSEATLAYDYSVGGLYCAQGSQIRVLEDLEITRTVGKAYYENNYYKIVADNYLTGKGAAILTSGAIKNNETVNYREPDNSKEIVKLDGNKLTAKNYPSDYNGLEWAPFSYTASNGTTGLFDGNNTVEIAGTFQNVTVTYRLTLRNFAKDKVFVDANLADVLNEEAKAQLDALKDLIAQKGSLEMMDDFMLGELLDSFVDKAVISAEMKAHYHKVIKDIRDECLDVNGYLKLYNLVTEYEDKDTLYHYYTNGAELRNEIAKFAGYMTALLGDDEQFTAAQKQEALKAIINAVPDKYLSAADKVSSLDRIERLEGTMNGFVESLKAPNEAIDLTSAKLAELTKALQAEGETSAVEVKDFLYVTSAEIVVRSKGFVGFTATLTIEGGQKVTISSADIPVGTEVPDKVVNEFITKIKAELDKQGVTANSKYYNTNYNAAILNALVGQNVSDIEQTDFEFTWTYKTFEVVVPGMPSQTVSLVDRIVDLAPSTDPAYRNDYYINGKKISSPYAITDEDLEKLSVGTFMITLDRVYVLREDLVKYVEDLNAAMGSGAAKFALIENEKGEYSIVLKLNASAPEALMNSIMGLAQGVVLGKYKYVGIGGDGFFAENAIHLQTILDTVATSGFGSQTIINAINANGTINHMTLAGNVIGGDNGKLGGKLIETTMQLGNNATETTNLAFYITVDNASAEVTQVRNALAQVYGNFRFECVDGRFGATLNMPQKLYEAFLAVLVITDNINLNNMNDVNAEITVSFINSMLLPLLEGNITVKTLENTLAKFGMNVDVSSKKGVEKAFAELVEFYKNVEFEYDKTTGTASSTLAIAGIINKLGLGELGSLIAEKDTGLKFTWGFDLDNLGDEYEALFVDIGANGVTNKIGLTSDVAAKLGDIEDKALIVLLSDVKGDMNVNTTTVFNLNGFTVDGNLKANGKTVVIDSYLGTDRVGTVTGSVSGNAIITAGKYSEDVSEYIKKGYAQSDEGIVNNEFFKLVEENGNLDIIINADILDMREMPDAASLAIEMACELLFNGYANNYLELDGNMIYNISVNDIIGIYTSSNRKDAIIEEVVKMIDTKQLSAFINTVLDDVFDFTSISNALANNTPVLEYGMVTKPWAAEFVHVEDGDYITANLANGEAKDRTLRVFVEGSEKNLGYLTDLFAELGKTIYADINVNISHGKNNNKLYVEVSADANVLVDWTNPDYAVMLSIIIADGIGSAKNKALVEGIEDYYATGSIAKLSAAFNKLTTSQVITAVKNISRDDSFASMVKNLGLTDVVDTDVYELDELYSRIEKVLAFVVRKSGISGGNRTMGSILDPDGAYGVSKSNIERMIKRSFFNYVVSAEVEVTDAYFGVKLFDENYSEFNEPEFIDGHGAPVIAENSLISAYKVDYDNKYIIVDIHSDGMEAELFASLISFTANNADNIEVVFDLETISEESQVKTGTLITATASNEKTTVTDVVEYTVVVLGDVNCDGYGDVADSIMICRKLVGDLEGDEALTEIQTLACDINNSADIDIGDATRIANKYVTPWDEYKSFLGEDEE